MRIHHSLLTAAALTVAVAASAGCASPQRQPAPAAPAPAAPAPATQRLQSPSAGIQHGTVSYPTPRAGSAYDDPSTGVSTVASSIPGAGTVRAVVLGNVAVIGTTSGDPAIYGRISQQIRSSFPHIADVRFTNNPVHVNRLGQALSLIQTNQSVAPMLAELWGIGGALPAGR